MISAPKPTERVAIVGRTGSGKTQMGAFLISVAPLTHMPYVIIDYKGDELLNSIERTREIGFNEVPKKPGLYILRSRPDMETETESFLLRLWDEGNTGLYVDEAYMLPNKAGLQAILTQGRSLRIPAIILSQRPVEVSRFVFSEADHIAAFHLNDDQDIKTLRGRMPKNAFDSRLPDFHSWWYSVKSDTLAVMKPVPDADTIREAIESKLPKRFRFL